MTDKKVKKVSKKKIVFVELDEEITSIFERLKTLPYRELYLVVPKRAVLLQSVVNLKILNQKLEEIDKTMAIITNDTNGMKLAHQAEIRVFDHWNIKNEKGEIEKKDVGALLKPISATSNEVDEVGPSRLPKKKSSIFEVVRGIRGKEKGFSLKSYLRDRKKNRLEKESWRQYMTGGRKKFISGLLLVSVAVFAIIAYVALPGATVEIEPASDVVTKAVNITLESNPNEPRSLKAYRVEAEVDLTIAHHATGILSEGSDSSGQITIINESDQVWPLVVRTRFQTSDGLIFRLAEHVEVPSGSPESPGTVVAQVIADELDANGVAIGERGNIGPSKFFLPGLREESQSVLYAESYTDMTGGETNVSAVVLEDDLIASREKIETQLKEKALSALRKETLSLSSELGIDLSLLEDSDVLDFGSAIVDVPYEVLNQEMETFDVSGTMTITGIAYDNEALLSILKTELISAETPGKQLVKIDESTVSVNVLEVDRINGVIRFTAQIQGIEEYEIDPELEGGNKLAKKIKEHIAGKTVEEAEQYVQNLVEVNSVNIKMWPAWSPTIPSLPENIRIKSLSDGVYIDLDEVTE